MVVLFNCYTRPNKTNPVYVFRVYQPSVVLPSHAYVPRFSSRSATATPITSPKKRQLPQIPHTAMLREALRERVTQVSS